VKKVSEIKEQDGLGGWIATNGVNLDASMRSDRPLINSKRDNFSTSPQRPIDRAKKAPNGKLEPIRPKGGP
jgi:hypothetical protein